MLSGPGVTKVYRKGIDPLMLVTSAMKCICESMKLMYCKNCSLCSVFWMIKVSSTYLSHSFGE